MECSTVAGAGDAVSRNKGGSELAAIVMTWFTLDDFFLMVLMSSSTNVLTKYTGLAELHNSKAERHHSHAL